MNGTPSSLKLIDSVPSMGCVLRLHHSGFFCLVNGKNDSFFFFLFFREKGSSRKRNIGVLKKKRGGRIFFRGDLAWNLKLNPARYERSWMVVEFGEEGGEIRSTQLFSSYIKTGEEESWPQLSPKKILPSTEKFSRHGSNRPLKLYFVLYSRKGEKGRDKSARISSLLSLFASPLSLGSARLGSARRNVVALPPDIPVLGPKSI